MAISEIQDPDSYKSIQNPSEGSYRELGSKFLSFAYPVSSEEEIKLLISNIKSEYFDARHHCYAYRLGEKGELWRANDDGEPSSTAGRPILGQILSNELSDILIVVVRYFGGTKLGVTGLIRAYKSAAANAIANAYIIEKRLLKTLKINFEYPNSDKVMRTVRGVCEEIVAQEFGIGCSVTIKVTKGNLERFQSISEFCKIEIVN